jgi:hypothetical protein
MRFWHFYNYAIIFFLSFISFNAFSQKNTVIRDTIVEEFVYEYDTVYIEDTKLNIDTLIAPKPLYPLLPSRPIGLASSNVIQKYPIVGAAPDSLIVFFSFEASGYSTIHNFENNTYINENTIKYNKKVFPNFSFITGIIKRKICYALSLEYVNYSEVLEHEKQKKWYDTIDNQNEIFYRTIYGRYKSVITNQYRFLHLNTCFGYNIEKGQFYFLPQLSIGAGFSILQKDYYYDNMKESIMEIPKKNKADIYAIAGINCQIGWLFKRVIKLYLKPYWQHCLINTSLHPIGYRDIYGLGLGVTYSINL